MAQGVNIQTNLPMVGGQRYITKDMDTGKDKKWEGQKIGDIIAIYCTA